MKIERAEFVTAAHGGSGLMRDDRQQIAFVGRSNVGKSSLMNRLLGRKNLARTSSKPGRTRAINYFGINDRFYFVDLPGYGYARAAKTERQAWAELIDRYLEETRPRVVAIQLVDGKIGATKLDVQAHEYLVSRRIETLVVATKIDRLPRGRRAAMLESIRRDLVLTEDGDLIAVSAHTGEGVKELWRHIETRLGAGAREQE